MAKKRANGEGSIRKKPNGRWEGRYTQGIDPSTGRAIQKSVSARTQAECKEKLAKAIRDNRGIPVNHNEDYTVAEWCRLWFETYSKPVIRPNTAKTYENMIENHIVPAIGGIKLKRLTAIQIQKMYNDSKTKGRVQRFAKKTDTALSGSTVRRIHMVLSSALKQAVKERIIPYNPCDNCRIPPKEPSVPSAITEISGQHAAASSRISAVHSYPYRGRGRKQITAVTIVPVMASAKGLFEDYFPV